MRGRCRAVKLMILVLMLFGSVVFPFWRVADASAGAMWGPDAGLPTVKLVDSNYIPTYESMHNCHDHDFVLPVSDNNKHPFEPVFSDKTYTQCAFYTNFGLISTEDIMQLNNSLQPYYLTDHTGILPIPGERSLFINADGLRAFDSPLNIFKLGPLTDFLGQGTTYKREYEFKSGIQARTLEDSSGDTVKPIGSVAASNNANWLIVQRDTQLIRVNTYNFNDLLSIPATVRNNHPFVMPQDDAAITNDGRFVALAGGDGPNFSPYDLSTCVADVNDSLDNSTGCGSINLVNYLEQKLSQRIDHISTPRFSDDGHQLLVTVLAENGTVTQSERVALVAPGYLYNETSSDSTNYMALGDSYASGEGAFDYFSGTDESDNKCHLSKISYPYLLEIGLHLDSAHSVACSGAKMVNINGPSSLAAQYADRPIDAFSSNWLPGYSPQLDFISQKRPDVVTVSVLGNDIGFESIIKKCIL